MLQFNHPELFDKVELAKAFRDSISKYEQLLTKDYWTVKQYHWIIFLIAESLPLIVIISVLGCGKLLQFSIS